MKKISRRTALQLIAGTGAAAIMPKVGLGANAPAPPAGAPATTQAAGRAGGAGRGRGNAAPPSDPPGSVIPPAPEYVEAPAGFGIADGPFKPDWTSLSSYQHPEWYRDAKLGIWAHWGPQCQPEMGDWYAKKMYEPVASKAIYDFHCKTYGHPSVFGWKDVCNTWKAENWDPDHLIDTYKKAGAKFFAAMANHHDNMDMWDSKYQPWNTVNVGPRKNIIAGFEKAARAAGLRFALTCHGDRSWDWLQGSRDADAAGGNKPGVQYDGFVSKADGKGKWWEGMDPQHCYGQYHARGRYQWTLAGSPPVDPKYIAKFFNRTIDLVDKFKPDLLYFDDTVLPMIGADPAMGLKIAAYLYNTNLARNGKLEAVMTGKGLNAQQRKALTLDVERGVQGGADPIPWQTDTCIGSWHYEKARLDRHTYKTPVQVIQMLIDIVSKNGTLMLNIPLKGDGTFDSDEKKVLDALTAWIAPNGEAIYGTRPFAVYGEKGPNATTGRAGQFGGASDVNAYVAGDYRFTQKGDTVFAFAMVWPGDGELHIKSLAKGGANYKKEVGSVELLGGGPVRFIHDDTGLHVTLPQARPNDFAWAIKVLPK